MRKTGIFWEEGIIGGEGGRWVRRGGGEGEGGGGEVKRSLGKVEGGIVG